MLPEEEEIRLEFLEIFQEVIPWEEKNEEKDRKEKKKKIQIEWIYPEPAAVARTLYDGASGWIVVLPFL